MIDGMADRLSKDDIGAVADKLNTYSQKMRQEVVERIEHMTIQLIGV